MTTEAQSSILVVDDNAQNRELAEAQLEAAGYVVVTAESGEQALTLFAQRAFDLVLLDILMPGMDGFETCRRLRATKGGETVPIVFLSAMTDLGTHEQALETGANDFLGKPINRTELLIRVRSLIRLKRLQDEVRRDRDALRRVQWQNQELTALVVHDLKNPLSSILANGQFVIEEPNLSDDARSALQDILSSSDIMHQMVMNLLDISRSEDGALLLNLGDLDLPLMVEELRAHVRRQLESRGQNLLIECAPDIGKLRGDRSLVYRILENLLDNCMKYTPSGGTIWIDVRRDSNFVVVRTSDEGKGIPASYREKIFEKYVQVEGDAQVHARTSRGLGLVFCRLATEAHGGKIWVEDNQPRGSAFFLRLPAGD